MRPRPGAAETKDVPDVRATVVVPEREHALEDPGGLIDPAREHERIHEPKRAGQERALLPRKMVWILARGGIRPIPKTRPSSTSSRWIAEIVPMTRESSAGRKPTVGIRSRLASSASDP
jgi:hypothetical protein